MRTHGLIDCDVHNAVPSDAALLPYLPARWRRHLELVGSRTYSPFAKGYAYPKAARFASRHDAWPPSGGPPGRTWSSCARSCWMHTASTSQCSTACTGPPSSATTPTARRWPPR